MSGVQAFL